MRKTKYLRFRRVIRITQGLLVIIWMILVITAKIRSF